MRHLSSVFPSIILIVLMWASGSFAYVGDLALPGNHPLTQAQAGEVLIAELRCAACHSGLSASPIQEKTAPNLLDVGSRIAPDYIKHFLASPFTVHTGTTMPDLLAGRPPAEREQIAEALTHFLVAQSATKFQATESEPAARAQGKALFHSVGCVACHGVNEAAAEASLTERFEDDEDEAVAAINAFKPSLISLEHIATKYSARSLSEFLFQPLAVRSSGRMPDMKLTIDESLAIASYLVGDQAATNAAFVLKTSLVEQGKNHFKQLNCAACHSLPGIESTPVIGSLGASSEMRGCLSGTTSISPRFNLNDAERQAILASLSTRQSANSDSIIVAKTLTTFRCIACHVRDDFGGVHDSHNPYFAGSELKLGDDGRIPPPLTLVGAKLRPETLSRVLFDGESVRPYMSTRMPQFGSSNLQHLPALLGRLDVLVGKEMKIPNSEGRSKEERERDKALRDAGRELLGDKGLNCIVCHNFNGRASQANQGIDLVTSYERLQPTWFNRYLRDPGAFRPRTVMPAAWPDGIAAFNNILDGDTDRQIEAIWHYLSLGTSAADPSGIRGGNTKITVENVAKTYRGRSNIAGFRGIAVGLPGGLNYAFNAETGTMSALWQGDFIGVNWSGQGSGNFSPASPPIALAQDVSFAQLADESAAWPQMPVMTKDSRTNPDPLYPKNLGYQFRGYHLGELSIPTMLYNCGTIAIEDRSVVGGTPTQRQLRRVLRLNSAAPQVVWFRALTGSINQVSDRVYRSDRLQLTIPQAETKLRLLSDQPQQFELLLQLQLLPGISTLEFIYEPLAE